jgi:hypothetical protein
MDLPCQGEPTGFASDAERDKYGLFLLAQIRYQIVVDNKYSWDEYNAVKFVVNRLVDLIKGDEAHEAIFACPS